MATQTTQENQKSARTTGAGSEQAIRQVLDRYAEAFRGANVDDLLSLYCKDVVGYDMTPPLQYSGREAYAKAWKDAAGMMKAPWIWETRDEKIFAGEEVAFAHHLVNCGGTTDEEKQESGWIRHTIGLEKQEGQWRIVHEQFSVPMDMSSGKALMDLKPESTH